VTGDKPEEETYSLIYTSLKHPIRRKILRMLKDKPLTFSEILEAVDIDSGHLSYHLENLGDLITHSPDGKYQLSSIGAAAVELMGGVEEHSHELSKPNLKLTQIFAKVYPLLLSAALIIAGLYFISFTTTVTTTVPEGVISVEGFPNYNMTVANVTAGILVLPVNATLGPLTSTTPEFNNVSIINLTSQANLCTINQGPISWQKQEKPYFYYGIAGLIIASVYPALVLIGFARNLRHKRKLASYHTGSD
jgi:DNA-binding transcriptional ArsR family regulator